MDKDTIMHLAELAAAKDPRNCQIGLYSGSSSVLDSTAIFMWFDSVEDFKTALLDWEPVIFELDSDESLAYQDGAKQILQDVVSVEDLGQKVIDRLNDNSDSFFAIHWCGTFNQLISGHDTFAADLRSGFRDEEGDAHLPIKPDEIKDFVEYLRNYGI